MDCYADLADIPTLAGILEDCMDAAFGKLMDYHSAYKYNKYTPNSSSAADVEKLFTDNLPLNRPVLMLNPLGRRVKYLVNDPVQAAQLGLRQNQNFSFHWMTVTKFYKANNPSMPNHDFVAISSNSTLNTPACPG